MNKQMNTAIGEQEATVDMGGELGRTVAKIKKRDKVQCHGICRKMTSTEDLRCYPHEGGLPDKDGKRWWLYVHCHNVVKRNDRKDVCGYETSWGKINFGD